MYELIKEHTDYIKDNVTVIVIPLWVDLKINSCIYSCAIIIIHYHTLKLLFILYVPTTILISLVLLYYQILFQILCNFIKLGSLTSINVPNVLWSFSLVRVMLKDCNILISTILASIYPKCYPIQFLAPPENAMNKLLSN